MNNEQKYKNALKKVKELLDSAKNQGHIIVRVEDIENAFPELKESEDEKIKKEIIAFIKKRDRSGCDYDYDKWITWLEKQGECKPITWSEEDEKNMKSALWHISYSVSNGKTKEVDCQVTRRVKSPKSRLNNGVTLHSNEPKFKVGDWLQYRYAEPFLVEEIIEQGYCNGNSCLSFEWEDEIHLWTIQDAKDGDVLVASDGSIFLFAGVDDCACKYYVALTTDNYVKINYVKINKEVDSGYWETSRAVYPATKEQRDLLFAKMKEAGYEWDNEKKELKKIEVKTLDPDKVIEWLKAKVYDDSTYGMAMIDKFKKDFGL